MLIKNLSTADQIEQLFPGFINPSRRCFLCGKFLRGEVVFWSGVDERFTSIWLHKDCAISLGKHLQRDGERSAVKREVSRVV